MIYIMTVYHDIFIRKYHDIIDIFDIFKISAFIIIIIFTYFSNSRISNTNCSSP